jgi:hypothetical protein
MSMFICLLTLINSFSVHSESLTFSLLKIDSRGWGRRIEGERAALEVPMVLF